MNTKFAPVALAIALGFALSGCNTTASSTHNPQDFKTGSIKSSGGLSYGRDGITQYPPASDYKSLNGDGSNQLLAMGKQNFADQNYGLSEKYFREAVAARTDNVSAWAGLAASYDQLGNFEKADRAYKALFDLKGNDPRVLNNMGYSFLLRGDYKKARTYFNKAQAAAPTLDQVQGNLHLLEKVSRS